MRGEKGRGLSVFRRNRKALLLLSMCILLCLPTAGCGRQENASNAADSSQPTASVTQADEAAAQEKSSDSAEAMTGTAAEQPESVAETDAETGAAAETDAAASHSDTENAASSGSQTASAPDVSDLVIGFSQLGSESAWRLGNTASMEKAAEKYGFSLVVDNGMQKQENQIAAIRSFIAYQVDVIVFAPIVEDGWANVLQEAKDAGIPVIMMDRVINVKDSDLYTAYIGPDHYQEGVNAAKYLLKKADELSDGKDGLIRIAELSGTEGSSPMISRYAGFHDLIDRDDRFLTLETISGDFLRSKGKECMETLLQKYEDKIDVLYSHNDAMTLGAIEVLEEHGIEPGKDIVIISVDGEQAAVDLLKEGKINCVVECSPMLGDAVMDLAARIVSGRDFPRIIRPDEGCFTEYDDLSELGPRGY